MVGAIPEAAGLGASGKILRVGWIGRGNRRGKGSGWKDQQGIGWEAGDRRLHSLNRHLRMKGWPVGRGLERWKGGSQAFGGLMGLNLSPMARPFSKRNVYPPGSEDRAHRSPFEKLGFIISTGCEFKVESKQAFTGLCG